MKTHSKRSYFNFFTFLSLLFFLAGSAAPVYAATGNFSTMQSDPPFSGTIFLDPDIITSSDPTTFLSATYTGQGLRTMFDRRVNDWVTVNAYLFKAKYSDGLSAEIQVNPEFGSSAAAQVEADKYGWVIGQLPTVLRTDVKKVWVHKGTELFGGGNDSILIHTGQTALYEADGILEETLVHEATHTSLDAAHAAAPGWLAAQTADGTFISTYARDNPTREDVAESFLPYLAVRYKADRIDSSLADTIKQAIPNRIAYFDKQGFDLYPFAPRVQAISQRASDGWIRESTSTSNTGGALNKSASTLNLGDDFANRQYRAILSFATNSLPDTAVITRVALKVKQQGVTGGGSPVSIFGGFMVDIKNGSFGTSGLTLGDFKSSPTKTLGAFRLSPSAGWYTLNLTNAKATINTTGLTEIRLRFKMQDNLNFIANILSLYSGEASSANRPQLIVQYYIP